MNTPTQTQTQTPPTYGARRRELRARRASEALVAGYLRELATPREASGQTVRPQPESPLPVTAAVQTPSPGPQSPVPVGAAEQTPRPVRSRARRPGEPLRPRRPAERCPATRSLLV